MSDADVEAALRRVAGRKYCATCEEYDNDCGCDISVNERWIAHELSGLRATPAAKMREFIESLIMEGDFGYERNRASQRARDFLASLPEEQGSDV